NLSLDVCRDTHHFTPSIISGESFVYFRRHKLNIQKASENLPDRRKAFKKIGKLLLGGGGMLTVAWFALGREGAIDDWVPVGPLENFPSGVVQAKFITVTA